MVLGSKSIFQSKQKKASFDIRYSNFCQSHHFVHRMHEEDFCPTEYSEHREHNCEHLENKYAPSPLIKEYVEPACDGICDEQRKNIRRGKKNECAKGRDRRYDCHKYNPKPILCSELDVSDSHRSSNLKITTNIRERTPQLNNDKTGMNTFIGNLGETLPDTIAFSPRGSS
jgi:hypothetical protein